MSTRRKKKLVIPGRDRRQAALSPCRLIEDYAGEIHHQGDLASPRRHHGELFQGRGMDASRPEGGADNWCCWMKATAQIASKAGFISARLAVRLGTKYRRTDNWIRTHDQTLVHVAMPLEGAPMLGPRADRANHPMNRPPKLARKVATPVFRGCYHPRNSDS